MPSPIVSIVMCVHNGERTVANAIDSILGQSFQDFEFIILDDGSTDSTLDILQRYQTDSRVKIYSQANMGLTKALNRAVSFAKGTYIARQDADDLSLPSRIEKQVAYLEDHPDVLLLGTNSFEEDDDGLHLGRFFASDYLNRHVYLHNPFAHTSAMFNSRAFKKIGGYNESFDTSQDFELWMRFAKLGPIAMLPDPLVIRRQNFSVISKKRRHRQFINGFRARLMHHHCGYFRAYLATVYQVLSNSTPKFMIRFKRRLVTRPNTPSR